MQNERDAIRRELMAELKAGGAIRPEDDETAIRGRVYAVLTHEDGSKDVYETSNLITNDGDRFYAERGANEPPTNFATSAGVFSGIMGLATAVTTIDKSAGYSNVTTVVSGSELAMDATYPQTNDPDGDNPGTVGVDIVTYRRSYTTGQANANDISHVYITEATPSSGSPVISIAAFAATFTKTASDTLKVYVNHEFTGA